MVDNTEEFNLAQGRCDLDESEDITGLKLDIRHLLALQNFDIVDEVVQQAIKAEESTNKAQKFNSFKGISQLPLLPPIGTPIQSSQPTRSSSKNNNM